jgi:hypothetical protein
MSPFGHHQRPFSRKMWERWLAELNRSPDPTLAHGLQEMRERLQARCLGEVMPSPDAYDAWVERQFGRVK